MLNTSFVSLTVFFFFFCTVCEYEFCTIIWNDTVSLFLYNLKVKRPLFSSLLQSNTCLFQVAIFTCYSEPCLYSLTEILDDWFSGVVTFSGKKMQWSPYLEQKPEADSDIDGVDFTGMWHLHLQQETYPSSKRLSYSGIWLNHFLCITS